MDKKVMSWRQFFGMLFVVTFLVGYAIAVVNIQSSTPNWVRWSDGLMLASFSLLLMVLPKGKSDAK